MSLQKILQEIDCLREKVNLKRPLKKAVLVDLRQYYRIGLTYTNNAVEGNTLTESETKVVLEDGLTIQGKPLKDHLEVLGHSDAYNLTLKLADSKGKITEKDILKLHHLFYHRIDEKNAGTYRNVQVFISGTDFVPPKPELVATEMKKMLQEFSSNEKIMHPVLSASFLHRRFVEVHPFIDGNGRVARLLMNLVLVRHAYPVTVIPPVRRADYMNALREVNRGNNVPFDTFIVEMALNAMREISRLLG